jgi:uncharacterized protein YdaU (DUF1376 family)
MMNAWYPHYPGDYARGTAHLSLVQHGAYRLLLDHYYATAAPLSGEITTLYRICRAFDETERKAVDFVVSQFFELRSDGYHNRRADRELAKSAELHIKRSKGAQTTNTKRWGNRLATRSATQSANRSSVGNPQPHPQPQEKIKSSPPAKPAGDTQEFLTFWNAYPKKISRQEARKSWHKAGCEGRLGEVMASLTAWKKTEQWGEPRFIPYPATWLNKGLWKEMPRPIPSLMDERRRLEAQFESGRR